MSHKQHRRKRNATGNEGDGKTRIGVLPMLLYIATFFGSKDMAADIRLQ
jgi:hypothetical protein